ncbi:MAG TPA: (Fe-S)-binding protein [Gammaproteobacteria bacterium]
MNPVASILAGADRCVMCGLCLPHCPTFSLTRHEAESPRGRIMLMQALAAGKMEADAPLLRHLDNCLACRSCERMCPSLVEYGRLIDQTRTLLQEQGKRQQPIVVRRLLDAIEEPDQLRQKAKALRLYQQSGVQWLARSSGLLKGLKLAGLEQQLPEVPPIEEFAPHYPATGARRGAVALFTGCLGSILDQAALRASIRLLNRLGYEVHIPPAQQCCGGLHHHQGELASAKRLALANIAAFATDQYEAILFTASGCGAQLADYGVLIGQDGEALANKVCDIDSFLAGVEWPAHLVAAPLAATVAVHDPCTLHNVLRQSEAPYRLLARIPQLQVVALEGNRSCCGAAGIYHLTHAPTAAALRAPKLTAAAANGAAYLASANFGCALHIAAGLREQGQAIEVLHPVVLLDRQLTLAGW